MQSLNGGNMGTTTGRVFPSSGGVLAPASLFSALTKHSLSSSKVMDVRGRLAQLKRRFRGRNHPLVAPDLKK